MRKSEGNPQAASRRQAWYLPPGMHYGWVIVLFASLLSIIAAAVVLAFGIFLVPISLDLGWSRGQVSLAYAIQFAAMALTSLASGWFTDRMGTRRTMALGGLMFAAGLILAGRSRHLWELYVYYGFLTGAGLSFVVNPTHVVVGLWFRQKLGLAIGIVIAATGLGPLIFAPVFRHLITVIGWGDALMLSGIGSGILILLASWFIRSQPSDIGLRAYGEPADGPSAASTAAVRPGIFYTGREGNFFRHARATQPFLWLILIHFLGCVSHSLPLTHVVALAQDAGVPAMGAASILGLISGFSIASRLGNGLLADRIGGKKAIALALAIQGASILMLLLVRDLWAFYVFAFIFAMGYGGEMVTFPVINRQYYGSAPIGTIYGFQMLGANLGMAAGGYLGGALFDLTGSYAAAIWAASAIGFAGVASALRLASPLPRRAKAPSVSVGSRS